METNRHRKKDLRVKETFRRRSHWQGNATIVVENSYLTGRYSEIDDTNNRNFRYHRDKGEVVSSDVCLYRNDTFAPGGYSESAFVPDWGSISYEGNPITPLLALHGPRLSYLADEATMLRWRLNDMAKCYAKLNESPLLAGEALSDFNKTFAMLRRPFSGAQKLLERMRASKRRRRRMPNGHTQVAAETWLEYRYGWKPLLLDAMTIVKELHNCSVKAAKPRAVVRSGFATERKVQRDAGLTGDGFFPSFCVITESDKCRVASGIIHSVKQRNAMEVAMKTLGLDLRSAPATIWEVIPFSFVVDWFVNVGDWIQAIVPDPAITVIDTWSTVVEEREWCAGSLVTKFSIPHSNGTTYNVSCTSPGSRVKELWYQRDVRFPLATTPLLTRKPISSVRIADALSLSASSILKGLKDFKH